MALTNEVSLGQFRPGPVIGSVRGDNAIFDPSYGTPAMKFGAGVDMEWVDTVLVPITAASWAGNALSNATQLKMYVTYKVPDTATGNVRFEGAVELQHTATDTDAADSFGTATGATVTVPTTANMVQRTAAISIPITSGIGEQSGTAGLLSGGANAIAAGDRLKFRLRRLGKSSTADTCTAEVYVLNWEVSIA